MALTFNQIQFRVLILLFSLSIGGTLSYRYFIELPEMSEKLISVVQKELSTLGALIKKEQEILSTSTYDYAVWTSTYDFMDDLNQDYIEENVVPDTFKSLEIDGIFLVDENLNITLQHGENHLTGELLDFSFLDFNKYPHHESLLPEPTTGIAAPQKSGFLNSQHGPAMYSVVQIRTSTLQGEHRGFFILVKLLGEKFTDQLTTYGSSKISYAALDSVLQNSQIFPVNNGFKTKAFKDKDLVISELTRKNYVQLNDMNGKFVALLEKENDVAESNDLLNASVIAFIFLAFMFFLLFYFLFTKSIIAPVKSFVLQIKKLNFEQGLIYLDEQHSIQELNIVSKSFNQLSNTINKQTELLAQQVTTDQLTQILNRRGLTNGFEQYKEQCIRHNVGFIVVMCDIDHFKLYNDTLGHIAGDDSLFKVAQTLNNQCLRANDMCGRFGGEEFTLVFSGMSESNLQKKLESILKAIKQLNIPHPKSPTQKHLTLSFGATIVNPIDVKGYSLSTLDIINHADTALYQAKESGRNGYVINHFKRINK